LAMYET
jgi:hypothetical protein